MVLIDAHCHLEKDSFADPSEVLVRAKAQGVVHAVVVGQWQRPGDFGSAIEVAAQHPDFLTPTMGIHPHDAAKATAEDWEALEKLCALPEVCAVGETGLDFYYDNSPREVQAEKFALQCALARKLGKPLVVHVRDAHQQCADILRAEKMSRGMIHCFTGDTEAARAYLDLGFHLSISGIVTYPRSQALQDAVAFAPLERLMVETDTPYLAPVPYRGKKNEPGNVHATARKVAELKKTEPDALALTCAKNARELLGLKVAL